MGYLALGDVEAGQAVGRQLIADDVFRQEREAHPPLHHLGQHGGAAQLNVGLQSQVMGVQCTDPERRGSSFPAR